MSLASCGPEQVERGIYAENHTSVELRFRVLIGAGGYVDLAERAEPGRRVRIISQLGPQSAVTKGDCTFGDLIAFAPYGTEVARRAPPLCAAQTWIIEPGPGASSQPSP